MNKIHEKYENDELRYEVLKNISLSRKTESGIVLLPLERVKKLSRAGKNFIACTGWAITWKKLTGLPLSSHADFNDLIRYITESNAEIIIPVYGFRKEFCSLLRNEYNMEAYDLSNKVVINSK